LYLHSDFEAFLKSAEMMEYLASEAIIVHQQSAPYRQHQNAVEKQVQSCVKGISALSYGQRFLKPSHWHLA